MIKRKKTKTIKIGEVKIGSGHPVKIQSMTNTDTKDVRATIKQIKLLEEAGCEIIRVSVKDIKSAKAILQIKKKINIPLVADIHFDYRLALEAIKQGADKIRINPGNIRKKEHIEKVILLAKEKKIPIRVGVNSGSLIEMQNRKGKSADIMVRSLKKYLKPFEKNKFTNIVLSAKSSDVMTTVEAYRKISSVFSYPIHLGITAAGSFESGIVKSSIGIGVLLMEGIGDTIRVSLTGDPLQEVPAAKNIISALGLRDFGYEIISCPTCGRCQVDLISIVNDLEKKLATSDRRLATKKLTIAVMGCEVNGPGEAKMADMGVAFGKGRGAIFSKGKIIKTVSAAKAVSELMKLIL